MPSQNALHLTPGALLAGKYRLRQLIGEGAMGVVWAAVNESTGREVALKLVVQEDPDLRARLLQEGRACGRLQHKHIVQIYDVDKTARGEPFLVMPRLTGETLAALIKRRRRLEVAEAARIGRDIARGLAAAHAVGIVHRDLKPSNVFLHTEPDEPDYLVKVLDFGVSKLASTGQGVKTATGIVLGSPAYMSPEQIRSIPDVDHRVDLWALGVVLYEMLAGVRPFQGSLEGVLGAILAGEIPSVSKAVRNLDPRLAEIVSRCLQRDRERRPGSATEIAAQLDVLVAAGAGSPFVPGAGSARPPVVSAPVRPGGAAFAPAPGAAMHRGSPPAELSWDPSMEVTLPLARADRRQPADMAPARPSHAPPRHGSAPLATPLPAAAGAWLGDPRLRAGPTAPPALDLQPLPGPRSTGRMALAAGALAVAVLLGIAAALYLARTGDAARAPSSALETAASASSPSAPDDSASPPAPPGIPDPASPVTADPASPVPPAPAPASPDAGEHARDPGSPGNAAPPGQPPSEPPSAPLKRSTASPPAPAPTVAPRPPPPTAPFDQTAARAALGRAAAAAAGCAVPGGPTGSGKARVLFGNDGNTLSAVLEGPVASTSLQGCLLSAFRRAHVPPFAGSPVSVVKSFTVR